MGKLLLWELLRPWDFSDEEKENGELNESINSVVYNSKGINFTCLVVRLASMSGRFMHSERLVMSCELLYWYDCCERLTLKCYSGLENTKRAMLPNQVFTTLGIRVLIESSECYYCILVLRVRCDTMFSFAQSQGDIMISYWNNWVNLIKSVKNV